MKRALCVFSLFVLLSFSFCGCAPTIANIDDLMRRRSYRGKIPEFRKLLSRRLREKPYK